MKAGMGLLLTLQIQLLQVPSRDKFHFCNRYFVGLNTPLLAIHITNAAPSPAAMQKKNNNKQRKKQKVIKAGFR